MAVLSDENTNPGIVFIEITTEEMKMTFEILN